MPNYSEAIQESLSLGDQYAYCIALEEEFGANFDPETHFWDDEGVNNTPGYDVWGVLYKLEPRQDFPPTAQMVDVQCLYSDDFFEDMMSFSTYTTRSENGKVVCIETGVAKDPQQDRNKGTPTIRTFFLDKKRGIDCSHCERIERPAQLGLSKTYTTLALSPSGDFLLGIHYDELMYRFYHYNKHTKTWATKWEHNFEHYFEGYYTADGDFCIFDDDDQVQILSSRVPGPMTLKRLLFLDPPDERMPFEAQELENYDDLLVGNEEDED